MLHRILAAGVLTAVVAVAGEGRADGGKNSLAEALFQAGKAAMASGKYDEACGKLTESQRLEPGGGTLLLLALCHESQGRHATAYAELRSAQSIARRDRRPDREKLASKHLAALEPKLARITIRRPEDGQVALSLDGTALTSDATGVALPVDPGPHRLEVTAPRKKPAVVTFTIGTAAEERTIELPRLEDAPAEAAPVPPAPSAPAVDVGPSSPASSSGAGRGATQRTVGWISVAAGGAAMAVGGYFGVRALSLSAEAKRQCDPNRCANPEALARNDDAIESARVSTIVLGAGLAVVVAGVVMVLTAPRDGVAPSRTGRSTALFEF